MAKRTPPRRSGRFPRAFPEPSHRRFGNPGAGHAATAAADYHHGATHRAATQSSRHRDAALLVLFHTLDWREAVRAGSGGRVGATVFLGLHSGQYRGGGPVAGDAPAAVAVDPVG